RCIWHGTYGRLIQESLELCPRRSRRSRHLGGTRPALTESGLGHSISAIFCMLSQWRPQATRSTFITCPRRIASRCKGIHTESETVMYGAPERSRVWTRVASCRLDAFHQECHANALLQRLIAIGMVFVVTSCSHEAQSQKSITEDFL